MIRALFVAGGLMLLLPAVQGGDDKAAQIKKLIADHEKANADFLAAYRTAKTAEERKELLSKRVLPATLAKQLMPLVESDPKSAAAGEALSWLASNAGLTPEGKAALGLLIEHHAKNPGVTGSLERLGNLTDPRIEKFLEQVMAENPSTEAKGKAAYALGKRHLLAADRGGRTLQQDEIDALYAKAGKLLHLVKANYASVKTATGTLGDSVKEDLYVLENFTVGKVAPDISGEDTDGNKFKLSDYRGKVVLLDFWGHW